MCGIAGLLNLDGGPLSDSSVAKRMGSHLRHRGPDEEGFFAGGPLSFAFRRLSIIDLASGQQPISNAKQSAFVMLNGEIYNFLELREELKKKGYAFRTKSDTEVIVYAYEEYGLDFVKHLRGMFAIALWDTEKKKLILARDRMGKKPLFYGVIGGQLAFASETKAFHSWPAFQAVIDPQALHDYLTFLFVPSPRSIFKNIFKLPPAHMLIADCQSGSVELRRYWNVSARPDESRSYDHFKKRLREILTEAVNIRLRSDVPLGAFLSGGIDSNIVVALMCGILPKVETFSIGFSDPRYDESEAARISAEHFKSVHHETIVDPHKTSPDDLRQMVWHMDEPFGDSSFIPTYWVAKSAREKVTVALSGDGGDELFGGYPRYDYLRKLKQLEMLPGFVRQGARAMIGLVRKSNAAAAWDGRLRQFDKAIAVTGLPEHQQAMSFLTFFDEASKAELYQDEWLEKIRGYQTEWRAEPASTEDDPLNGYMLHELQTSMADDSVCKTDRASMACSLEVRSPFLDQELVQFAMTIPSRYKLVGGKHKVILKDTFQDLLPPHILSRKKQGFEVPFGEWFQQPSWKELLSEMLSRDRLQEQKIFDPAPILQLRDELIRNPAAAGLPFSPYQLRHRVWAFLIFQMWFEQFVSNKHAGAA